MNKQNANLVGKIGSKLKMKGKKQMKVEVDKKEIAKKCLIAFKYLGIDRVEWKKNEWVIDEAYILYLYEKEKQLSKKEEKIIGTKGIIGLLDGTECENIAILFEVLAQVLLVEDKVCYNIDDIIKVVEKWKKNG